MWVASFFFAGCPGTCRQLNFSLAEVGKDVPKDVRPGELYLRSGERHARHAGAPIANCSRPTRQRWKFLTGDMQDLQRLAHDSFQVALEKQTHTEKAFVVDRQGQLRGRYNLLDPAQREKLELLVEPPGRRNITHWRSGGKKSLRRLDFTTFRPLMPRSMALHFLLIWGTG